MTYLFLYFIGIILIWYTYREGWISAIKMITKVLVPSFLIILFNFKAGRLIFRNPIIGIISSLPTAILIFKGSQPLISIINNVIDNYANHNSINNDFIDTEATNVDE